VAKKVNPKRSAHVTDRALRDIAGIESHSIEQFGKRVAAQYADKIEAGIGHISNNPDLALQVFRLCSLPCA